jgi:NitT/TauT family transport system ATP-binding protein
VKADGKASVSLRGIGKTFANGVAALRDLSFDVREGETLTLLGPSGCGKSTALRLIAGLSQPTAGSIAFATQEARANIGFVFQEPTLLPWTDVLSNVYLPLRLRGEPLASVSARVAESLERVGLSAFKHALPRELSGGMKMRAAIARALVTRPSLLLMDEPFAALDEVTRFKLNDDLLALKRDLGTTIVFVTHSVYESVYLSTRILVLSPGGGRIVDEIEIDAGLTRDAEFRLGATFSAYCRRASKALQTAMSEKAA